MATSSDFALKITKLNGSNYRNWAFNIRLYLQSFDLYGHVDGSAVSPGEDASDAVKQAFRTASKKAWTYICLAIEPGQQIHVRDTTTAKQAWDALKNQFQRESILQKIRLRQQYYTCKFHSGGNMLAHINNMRSLHDQLKEMGINVDDKELAMTLLGSLPEEFKPLITALDAVGENNLSYEKVKGMLLNDVDRKSDMKKNEDAFSAQRGFSAKGKDGRDMRGHFARDCPKKNPKNKKFANVVKGEQEEDVHEVTNQEALFTSNDDSNCGWIIDSGATQHMTSEKNRLVNYVEFKQPCKVNLGDDRTIFAFGKGAYNLVADLVMGKLGALIQFDGVQCKIERNSKLLATGELHGKLYMLKIIPGVENINVAREATDKICGIVNLDI
ncbi:RNA-dependent DNA polymerase [Paramuricea clavata]|uniref:RNA-dependent DNA polymerase n=1 Tax=Paramuricea clavata TaxID=317549 RepID=A0A6S7JG89_PARCT|nr:RNA-dependent DNA polymerase [Paramuricea clavata]